MLTNKKETTILGRIGTKGRVEYYFTIFGVITILFIEMKLKIGAAKVTKERLDIIAQVIAECDGKPRACLAYIFFAPDMTSRTPQRNFFDRTAYPMSSSSLKETLNLANHLLSKAAFLEIQSLA
jgi:hypothetical protein